MKKPVKKNPYLFILGFSIAWTLTQAAFRAVYNARQNEVVKEAAEPAAIPTPDPNFQLVPASGGRVMELLEPPRQEAGVAVMPWDNRYHNAACPYSMGGTLMGISEARRRGYKPCRECGS